MSPSNADIRAAVREQKSDVAGLFDALRAGSLDAAGPGVTRDTYGAGEQFAHRVIDERAAAMGLERHTDQRPNRDVSPS